MKRVVGVLKLIGYLLINIAILMPVKSFAASNILITEIQAGSQTSASEEYIQITNTGNVSIDLSSWKLEYFAASAKDFNTPSRSINLSVNLAGGADLTIASNGYITNIAKLNFSPGLAATGGHVRLISGSGTALVQNDLVGWGNAAKPLGSPAPSLSSGEILSRKVDSSKRYINTEDNSKDFEVMAVNSPSQVVPSVSTVNNDTNEFKIKISELLPNPAKPATDANGEFIELYNPNATKVSLAGFKLQTGDLLNHSFIFKDQTIEANSYKAFYITETKATQANNSGKAKLLDQAGQVEDETSNYTNAPEGSSWAWDGSIWKWTTTITPNAENIITMSDKEKEAKTKDKKASDSKTAKSKSVKTSTKGKATSKKEAKPSAVLGSSTDKPAASPMHPGVLAGVGGLAILYGGYEYKQDFINLYHKLRRNRKTR